MGKSAKFQAAIGYCRVSTDEQAERGTSLDTQRASILAKADQLQLPMVDIVSDEGVSGVLFWQRQGLQQLLSRIEHGEVTHVICYDVTRLSRSLEHIQVVRRMLQTAGVQLVLCTMAVEASPEGNLSINVMGALSQFEREKFRQRAMDGKRRRAESGRQPNRSRAPFGYVVVTKAMVMRHEYDESQLGQYVVVPDEAGVIKQVFEKYAAGGIGLSRLAHELNERRIPTPKGAKAWHPSTLRVLLTNQVYAGTGIYGRRQRFMDENRTREPNPDTGRAFKNPYYVRQAAEEHWIRFDVPGVVPIETWERIQEKLSANQATHSGNPRYVTMLAGLAVCRECGRRMLLRKRSGRRPAYVCSKYSSWMGSTSDPVCSSCRYFVDEAERAAVTAVLDACQRPEAISAAYEVYRRCQSEPNDAGEDPRAELVRIDKVLGELRDREILVARAQIEGLAVGADTGTYLTILADIAAQRKDLLDRQGTIKARLVAGQKLASTTKSLSSEPSINALKQQALADAAEVLSDPNVLASGKRDILHSVVSKVYCVKGGAEVYFKPEALNSDTTVQNATTISVAPPARAPRTEALISSV